MEHHRRFISIFFFQAEDGIRDGHVTGVQTCALPISAMYPILEKSLGLTFTQLGMITLTLNMVASVMQPVIGLYTDKRPLPAALPLGLTSSMLGMLGLAFAPNFWTILICVFFIGIGSATFHPRSEERRVGKRHWCGMAP